VDIRVGKIIWVENNTQADKLYNEKVDIGDGEPRDIASGLREHIPIEGMKD
jgi:tRNA-binding EMAP/Myf-like protein